MRAYFTDRTGTLSQLDATSDIARCIMPLLDALGSNSKGQHQIVEAFPHNIGKITLTELIDTMANLKYENSISQATLEKIPALQMPCFFLPRKGAAQVLIQKHKNSVFAFDGGVKEYVHLDKLETKGLLVHFTSAEENKNALVHAQKDWFYKLIIRFKPTFYIVFFMTLLLNLLVFCTPLFVIAIYGKIAVADAGYDVDTWLIGISLFLLANLSFSILRSQYVNFFSLRIGNLIGHQVLRRMLYLPPQFTEASSMGEQISRIKDFEHLRDFMSSRGPIAVLELFLIILMIGCMYLIGGALAIIPIVAIVLFIIGGIILYPFIKRACAESSTIMSKRQEFLLEMVPAMRAIKFTSASRLWVERYKKIAAEVSMAYNKNAKLNAIVYVFSQTTISFAGLATMGIGVYLVLNGLISASAIIGCFIVIWRILAPLNTIFNVFTQIDQLKKSILQLDDLMKMPFEVKQEANLVTRSTLMGKIEFARVSIRYNREVQPALIGVSFGVNRGRIVQVVGPTGSGKSTILHLMLGMYEFQAGRIYIDNMNIKQMDPVMLRRSIAYSPKVDHFFQGTIAQNLLAVKPYANLDEHKAAAEKAGVLKDIEAMEHGFGTKIKENNILHFSTSFKKRLSLAKAFLIKARVLLLDAPDEGLNSEQVAHCMKSLDEMKGRTTIFIVSENPEFFSIADSVLWMDEGRIKMMGKPKQVGDAYLDFLEAK